MSKRKKRRYGVLISFLLCSTLAVTVSLWQVSFQEDSMQGALLSWSNGCLAAAALWGAFGLLLLIARFDGFRAIQYLGYTFRVKLSKMRGDDSRQLNSYYDYVQKKRETQREGRLIKIFLIPAILYLGAAIILTVLFERLK